MIPEFLEPNNSEVIDTAAENMNPEETPINPVATPKPLSVPMNINTRKAIGIGTRESVSHPVLVVELSALHGKFKNKYIKLLILMRFKNI